MTLGVTWWKLRPGLRGPRRCEILETRRVKGKELLDVVREAVVVGWKGELQEFGWDLRIKRPHFGETTTFWGNN